MRRLLPLLLLCAGTLVLASVAMADHIPGSPCNNCASHANWPRIDGVVRQAKHQTKSYTGTARNDQLMGHHGSDTLSGRGGSDVLWGDWAPSGQPTSQRDRIFGGAGNDFIFGSHGWNTIRAGAGNDAISVHYGRGIVDCGPGRDIYHVARSRRRAYKFRNCEKVDYRSERQRGGGLKTLR
jgi:Ca2+-binding RTX toxin-like protein